MSSKVVLLASLTIAIAISAPCLAGNGDSPTELRDWLDGPVRYIAMTPEVKAFKKLDNDHARAAFIEAFWSRRDSNPDTLVNEYRQEFWERVRYANERFVDSSKPGWKSDRGKIYILYGPPSRIEDDITADTRIDIDTGRGLIRWIYEGSERGRKDINPVVVVVPFVRDTTGEYHLSNDPNLASEFYTWDDVRTRSSFEDVLQTQILNPSRSPLAVMLDMGKMQTVPPQEEILLAQVETVEVFGGAPLPVAVHRYHDPKSDGSVLTLTVTLPQPPGDDRAAVLARIVPQGRPDAQPILLGEGSFRFEGEGSQRQAQARTVVDPGSYELTVLAVVPATSSSSAYKSTFEVPVSGDGDTLQMSDVTLARQLERVRYDSLASYTEPYMVGVFRVVPRVSDQLRRGDDLALFYEIYGGSRPYNVTYRLEIFKDSGWKPVSRPIVQEGGQGAQGWSVPTSEQWPVGKYRVLIAVEDSAGATHEAELDFALLPAKT